MFVAFVRRAVVVALHSGRRRMTVQVTLDH